MVVLLGKWRWRENVLGGGTAMGNVVRKQEGRSGMSGRTYLAWMGVVWG